MPHATVFGRRTALALLSGLSGALLAPSALAFGQAGTFSARLLSTGGRRLGGVRKTAPARWEWELVRRTSAPARLVTVEVSADKSENVKEPFLVWAGSHEVLPLTASERRGLGQFFELGGILVVDDSDPKQGVFGRSARRELRRILPESPLVRLDPKHVDLQELLHHRIVPVGRVAGPRYLEGISRGKNAQVIFLQHDLLGALSRADGDSWALEVDGGSQAREMALRLAVNLAMYVLCSDYKDDSVHAPWLMRRRARSSP